MGFTNKYHNVRTEYGGRLFDSKREANHAALLDTMRRAADPSQKVVAVEYQVPYILQDAFTDFAGEKHKPIIYVADFVVSFKDGHVEVQDVKSPATVTPVYKLKKKMLLFRYGIKIIEIY